MTEITEKENEPQPNPDAQQPPATGASLQETKPQPLRVGRSGPVPLGSSPVPFRLVHTALGVRIGTRQTVDRDQVVELGRRIGSLPAL
uniref:Uncharacterized protein n=1 Tax=Sphaerodactylus townsendi TaxID=933632 RepID=A0ACB8EU06_9SAUR